MPVTQQDLLQWTHEYSSLRKVHPHLQDFNEWIKTKIQEREDANHSHSYHAPIPINVPPATQHKEDDKFVLVAHSTVHIPASNSKTPIISSVNSPSLSPSPCPSPPLITPKKQTQSHLHPHTSIPTLRNSSPISSSPNLSSSSRPFSSSDILSSHLSHTSKTRNNEKKFNQVLFKDKTPKRRHVTPPRTLVRSLSQSLVSPRPSQQISHITFDYPNPFPPSEDVAELREYLNQFQAKQQNQLFQIFDIVENINNKLSVPTPTNARAISSSRGKSPSKVGRMVPATKSTHPILHPVSPPNKTLSKREPSPFAAIFRDQIGSIRKILQDEYNRTLDDTSYTKKLYQMTKLRKVHQVSVEFLLSLAQKMQMQVHHQKGPSTTDLGTDLGMIISQLAGLNAEMQMKFPFLFSNASSSGIIKPKSVDPFSLKLANPKRTAETTSQTPPSKSESGSQTKNKDANKRIQTDHIKDNPAIDMTEVNDNIQKISSDTELLKNEFDELKSVAHSSTEAMLKKYESIHRESTILDKEANKELKELKLTLVSFLDKFEQMEKERYDKEDVDKEAEMENRLRRERLEAEEKERKLRLESERREREERHSRDREDRDRKERREREERDRLEREAREKRDKEYRERKEKEEKDDRDRKEREEQYKRELEELARLEKEEYDKIENERRLREEREWKRRIEQERQAREERERKLQQEREKREREEQEREREERERIARDRERERERQERERMTREKELEREREERERIAREKREREREREAARERELEREREREEQERLARERERQERIERERLDQERQSRLELEKMMLEKAMRDRARLDKERLEREKLDREARELAGYKRENAQNLQLLMSTLQSMEQDELSLRSSTQSLLQSTPTKTALPRKLPKPNRGITDRVLGDVFLHNAKEVDSMCDDYLDHLVRLQVDEITKNPGEFSIADLL